MIIDDEYRNYLTIISTSAAIFFVLIRYIAPRLCDKFLPKEGKFLSDSDKSMIANSFISGINGIIAAFAALYILLQYNLGKDILWADSHQVRILSCIESGYFIADFIAVILTPDYPGRNAFFAHHVACLLAYYAVIAHRAFAFHLCLRTLNEFSSPFFNARFVLAKLNMKQTKIYVINGTIFMVSFFLGRIAIMPIYYYFIMSASYNDQDERSLNGLLIIFYGVGFVVDALNIYWFNLIVKGFIKYFFKPKNKTEDRKKD